MDDYLRSKAQSMGERSVFRTIEKGVIVAAGIASTWAKETILGRPATEKTAEEIKADATTDAHTKTVSEAVTQAVGKAFAEAPGRLLNEEAKGLLAGDIAKRVIEDLGDRVIEGLGARIIKSSGKQDKIDELMQRLSEFEVKLSGQPELPLAPSPALLDTRLQELISPPKSLAPARFTDPEATKDFAALAELPSSPSVRHQPAADTGSPSARSATRSVGGLESVCYKCEQVFPSRNTMHAHIRRAHHIGSDDPAPPEQNRKERRLACSKCRVDLKNLKAQKRESRGLEARKEEHAKIEGKIVKLKKKAKFHATIIQRTEIERELERKRVELEALTTSNQLLERSMTKPKRRASM